MVNVQRVLEVQYDTLIKKVERGEIPTVQDLPRISSVPTISRKQRQIIYEQQKGFEFHGMESKRLSTILDRFSGHAVWVPPDCKSRNLTYKEFEGMLRNYVSMSSTYGDIFLIRENSNETTISGFSIERMFWPSITNPYLFSGRLEEFIKDKVIRPKLTIIDTGSPLTNSLSEAYRRIEHIGNKLWMYIDWLHER